MSQPAAQAVLRSETKPPLAAVLEAVRAEVRLSDYDLAEIIERGTRAKIARWRTDPSADDPPIQDAKAIEELRALCRRFLEAGYGGRTIKSFIQSRNTGLGMKRPIDGLRVGAFDQVRHVTECWIVAIVPVPSDCLSPDAERLSPDAA